MQKRNLQFFGKTSFEKLNKIQIHFFMDEKISETRKDIDQIFKLSNLGNIYYHSFQDLKYPIFFK